MKVLHAYCLNYNLGDHALGIGVKNVLRHFLNVTSIAETNLQGQVFDDSYIDRLNQNYDLLVIGGGGIIHGAHWPQGWFWLIEKENIQKIHIPFIIYAAGYNYFKGEGSIPQRAADHLKETQRRALYFSVRNDGSFNRLRLETGIIADVIPDPGFWVSLDRVYSRPIEKPFVIVQLANDKPDFRFGSKENRARFIDQIRTVTRHLASRYTVVFSPHVLADVTLCNEVVAGIDRAFVWDFGRYAYDRTYECLGYYQYAQFVLAMRGHGQILPLGFGVPVISLENHAKNIGLMKNLNLEDYNVNMFDPEFVDKVISLADELPDNARIKNTILENNRKMFEDTSSRFVQIANSITKTG